MKPAPTDDTLPRLRAKAGASTRVALIEAAETMIAKAGVEGVSIRQVGNAIGSANPSAVTYHFGSKDALIEAIYRHRVPILDARRQELLKSLQKEGRASQIADLMHALWQPLFEQVNDVGEHSYARFLISVFRAGLGSTRSLLWPEFPTSPTIIRLIRDQVPCDVRAMFNGRWPVITFMILNGLQIIDQEYRDRAAKAECLFRDMLEMARNALLAPATHRVEEAPDWLAFERPSAERGEQEA